MRIRNLRCVPKTEIRTIAKLPQKFPNNQWVHRLEKEIGLRRDKDSHGIIQWQI